MKFESYTPENICTEMGIKNVHEDPVLSDSSTGLRILLRPSFHPELCLTFFQRAENAFISITNFHDILFHKEAGWNIPRSSEEVQIPLSEYIRLFELGKRMAQMNKGAERLTVCDGMPFIMWVVEQQTTYIIESNAGEDNPIVQPIIRAIQLAYKYLLTPACKNAVAVAGGYVDLELEQGKIPTELPIANLLFLGPQEDTSLLSKALRKHGL